MLEYYAAVLKKLKRHVIPFNLCCCTYICLKLLGKKDRGRSASVTCRNIHNIGGRGEARCRIVFILIMSILVKTYMSPTESSSIK